MLFIERKVLHASWSVSRCWFVIFGTVEGRDSYHINLYWNVVTYDFTNDIHCRQIQQMLLRLKIVRDIQSCSEFL